MPRQVMPLISPPKYRCVQRFFRNSPDEHVLVAVAHHIAADGSSLTPLVRDLGAAYVRRSSGRVPDCAVAGAVHRLRAVAAGAVR